MLRTYDHVKTTEVDWKFIYQARSWAARRLRMEYTDMIKVEDISSNEEHLPDWRVSGDEFLGILRDMALENSKIHVILSSYARSFE